MENIIKNYGIDLEKEKQDQSPKDWKLKGKTVSEIELDNTVIKLDPKTIYDHLPIGELQKGLNDFMDCASRAPINVAETIFNYALSANLLHPENVKWLINTGYVVEKNGRQKVEFSDRFIAIESSTTNSGNSLKAPVEAIYDVGLIPKKMFRGHSQMYRNEYLNKKYVTQEMEDVGLEFKRRFPLNFYKIYKHEFEKVLHISPVDVAGHAWTQYDRSGVYPANYNLPINHAFMYFAIPKYKIFDNYIDRYDGDWIKRLAPNYLLLEYGYWLVFKQRKLWQAPADGETINDANDEPVKIKKGAWLTFIEFWNLIFKKLTGK